MWVQTPNCWFQPEPYFHWFRWQGPPRRFRVAAIQRIRFGHRGPCPSREDAEVMVDVVRLLIKRELVAVFPGTRVHRERILGLTRSFVMLGGFDGCASSNQTDSMACIPGRSVRMGPDAGPFFRRFEFPPAMVGCRDL
jgi:hypothetical protein